MLDASKIKPTYNVGKDLIILLVSNRATPSSYSLEISQNYKEELIIDLRKVSFKKILLIGI